MVKGVSFVNLKMPGTRGNSSPIRKSGADELVFLDISASVEGRSTMAEVARVAREISIPLTVGGGIRTLDIRVILACGAEKVSINSAAVKTRRL